MAFGENLRRLRQDRGWTQGDLALKSGVKLNHISRLEKDSHDPGTSTVLKLMDALSCSADTLIVDIATSNTKTILSMMMDRAEQLPEHQQRVLCEVIDAMCVSHGVSTVFAEGKRRWAIYDKPVGRIEDELGPAPSK